jgi:TolB protein
MNADGGHARRLTRAKIKDINDLAWTPHARTITFVASYIFSQIGIVNTDGSGQRLLVRDAAQNDDDPAWSPDGRRLVFRSDRDGSGQLYVADRNGRSQAPLLPAGQPYGAPSSPAWSPDARLIAFVGSKASFPENISRGAVYVMRPDGSQVRHLTGPRIASPVAIRWSPNGKSIAFACLQGKQTYRGAEPKRICIVGRDGAGFSKLSGPASTYDDPVASWSPHGRWLAYDACNQLSCRVVITPASGGKWHTLGNSRVRNATPAWQPTAR